MTENERTRLSARPGGLQTVRLSFSAEGIARGAGLLREGRLVAFPTETVYGLGADGLNPSAVARIFTAKGRPADNPLILHVSDIGMAEGLVKGIPSRYRELLDRFWPGPLTVVLPRRPLVPNLVTAGLDSVAVRCPDHPVAQALIRAAERPLAAPSANRSGRPSPTRAEHVVADLAGRIDAILDGGLTGLGVESTVVSLLTESPVVLRLGGLPVEELLPWLPGLKWTAPGEAGTADRPLAPGMKYRHYAPRAEVVVIEGEPAARRREILHQAESARRRGAKTAVLLLADQGDTPPSDLVIPLGSEQDLTKVAANLFAALREADWAGVEQILVEAPPLEGLGLAIRDRLYRAAAKVVHAGGR